MIQTKATYSGQEKTDALSGKLTFEQDKNRIIGKDDDNMIRLAISTNPFGMKVSKAGFDATSAVGDQLIFNSDQNIFKIVRTASVNVTVPDPLTTASPVIHTIPHNLGYRPAFIVYVEIPTSSAGTGYASGKLLQLPLTLGGGGTITVFCVAYVDNTNLYIEIRNVASGGGVGTLGTPWSFRYYLMQETAN